jgi:hypothetical protein
MTESRLRKFLIWKSSKLAIAILGTALSLPLVLGMAAKPAHAMSVLPTNRIFDQAAAGVPVIDVRAVVRRGGVVVGPRGGAAYRSRTVVRGGGGAVVRRGAWVRPARYWWRPGGAVAAGAAVGFVTAATAVAWAGSPPAPGYCWYYTDASRQQGFWDACP